MISNGTPKQRHEHNWDRTTSVMVETAAEGEVPAFPCTGCKATLVMTSDDAVELLQTQLGAEVIAEYENKPEYVLIAAVREDPHAFDGMWYPTALSEDGIGLIEGEVMDYQNLFFIHVSTDVEGLV